mgnify:CR=1 FL=1
MKEQEFKKLIFNAISKGWVTYGGFETDVATDNVYKLITEQLNLPVIIPMLLCIDNRDGKEEITIGKQYPKLDEDYKYYYIIDDVGEKFYYRKGLFEIVEAQ